MARLAPWCSFMDFCLRVVSIACVHGSMCMGSSAQDRMLEFSFWRWAQSGPLAFLSLDSLVVGCLRIHICSALRTDVWFPQPFVWPIACSSA